MLGLLGMTAGLSVVASGPSSWLLALGTGFGATEWAAGALEMLSIAAASSPVAAILFLFRLPVVT